MKSPPTTPHTREPETKKPGRGTPAGLAYIHKAKRVYGLDIESITEMHGGEYAGKHARYVLRSKVRFADPADASNAGGDQ